MLDVWAGVSDLSHTAYAPYTVLSDSDLEVAGASATQAHFASLRHSLSFLRLRVDYAGA